MTMLVGRYNSTCSGLMSGLARNFVDLQSQLAAAVSRVTIHVPAALSALAGKTLNATGIVYVIVISM